MVSQRKALAFVRRLAGLATLSLLAVSTAPWPHRGTRVSRATCARR